MKKMLQLLAIIFLISVEAYSDVYVSPKGLRTNAGTYNSPWDLKTGLSRLRPGDTLCLLGGVYADRYLFDLQGTATQPITVRNAPFERAIIDGAVHSHDTPYPDFLTVRGSYGRVIGLEITDTGYTTRLVSQGFVQDGTGLVDQCTVGCKFINNVIHNIGANGIGSFSNGNGSEFYGNLTFLNGYEAADGTGRAHGFYIQNTLNGPVKLFKEFFEKPTIKVAYDTGKV